MSHRVRAYLMAMIAVLACGAVQLAAAAQGAAPAAPPASPRAPAPAGAPDDSVRLSPPARITAFTFVGRHDYENPAEGVMLRYATADSLTADVFVYPGPDFAADCPMECAREVLAKEIEGFIGLFPEMIRRGYLDSVRVAADEPLTPDSLAAWRLGRHLTLAERRGGRPHRSDYYLFYLPRARVKVRATYADSARAPTVRVFADALVPALTGTGASPVAAGADDVGADGRSVQLTTTVAGTEVAVYERALAALVALGYAIADSSAADGRIVTAPQFAWPKGTEREAWHGRESPGVAVAVLLVPAGDSTRVEIHAHSPVRADWRDAAVAQQLGTIALLQVAAELTATRQREE